MNSKTPQFDALLQPILDALVPHTRTCKECKNDFQIMEGDIELLRLLHVPPPESCPLCRQQNRLAFTNYSQIFKRVCQAPGHTETVISLMPPVMPWLGYDYDYYYSDAWNPLSFGQQIDKEKNFHQQFRDLLGIIPQPLQRRGPGSVNSDFSFYGNSMKNCYYVFSSWNSENVLYGTSIFDSRDIVDSFYTRFDDTCYRNVLTSRCYRTHFAYFSDNCIDCNFIYDCSNCQNCFGCVNLRNKKYCIFNEQFSKEEYEKRMSEIHLGSRSVVRTVEEKFWGFVKSNPIRATRVSVSENSIGNDIDNSKNAYMIFQGEECENVRYGQMVVGDKDCMDFGFCGGSERLYQIVNVGSQSSNVKFSYASKFCTDCEFIMSCRNCSNCFGCVGLDNVSFAVFNTVYEPEEYFRIVDELKVALLKEGTYGSFLPYSWSNFSYNASMAQVLFPLTKEQALAKGAYWQEEDDTVSTGALVRKEVRELPDDIKDVPDEVTSYALLSEESGKPFRIVADELAFYKRFNIALPTNTPLERNIHRFEIMSNFRIHKERCASCGEEIWSAYKASEGWRPYCEVCYQKEIL